MPPLFLHSNPLRGKATYRNRTRNSILQVWHFTIKLRWRIAFPEETERRIVGSGTGFVKRNEEKISVFPRQIRYDIGGARWRPLPVSAEIVVNERGVSSYVYL